MLVLDSICSIIGTMTAYRYHWNVVERGGVRYLTVQFKFLWKRNLKYSLHVTATKYNDYTHNFIKRVRVFTLLFVQGNVSVRCSVWEAMGLLRIRPTTRRFDAGVINYKRLITLSYH